MLPELGGEPCLVVKLEQPWPPVKAVEVHVGGRWRDGETASGNARIDRMLPPLVLDTRPKTRAKG
jgi:hypothetical protein